MSEKSLDDFAKQIEWINNRLALYDAERAIIENVQRYAFSIDDGLDEEWVDCFTVDGVFEVKTRFDVAFRVQGRKALTEFIEGHTKAPARWHKHITTSHRIQIDGATANAQSYIIRVDNDDDGVPKLWVFGRYLDNFIRCVDGRWRFQHRIISLESVHPTQVQAMLSIF